jgi:trans-aconitate methyltransferase
VLEFGCGTGSLAATLLSRLPIRSRYVGLDSSKTMVQLARKRLHRFAARAIVAQAVRARRRTTPQLREQRLSSTSAIRRGRGYSF